MVSCMKKKILTFLIVPLYNVVALCTLTFGYYCHKWYIDLISSQPMLVSLSEGLFVVAAMCGGMILAAGEIIAFVFSIYCFVGDKYPDRKSLREMLNFV